MRRIFWRSLAAIVCVGAVASCSIFAVRMPARAMAGSSIGIEIDLRQSFGDGDPDLATHCARLPAAWTVTTASYRRTVGGVLSSGVLSQAAAGNAAGLETNLPLAGHTWRCFSGPSTVYGSGDFGTAIWNVTVQTPGTYDILFVVTDGGGSGVVSNSASRRIAIDAVPDWRFDSRSTTTPAATGNWQAVKALSDASFVAVDDGGAIHVSTNGGVAWSTFTVAAGVSLNAIERVGVLLVAAGANGSIYTASSASGSWTSRTSGTTSTVRDACTDGVFTYLVGDDGYVALSANGVAWAHTVISDVGDVVSCAVVSADTVYAVTTTGKAFRIVFASPTISAADITSVSAVGLSAIAYIAAPTPKLVVVGPDVAYEKILPSGAWTTTQSLDKSPRRLRVFDGHLYAVGFDGLFAGTPAATVAWQYYGSGTDADLNDIAISRRSALLGARGGVRLHIGIPELAFDGTSLGLPRAAPGAVSQAAITLRNVGKGVLYTGAPQVTAPFTATSDCDEGVTELAECEVTVSLSSTTRGTYTGTLTVPSSSSVQRSVSVTGLVGDQQMITVTLDGASPVTAIDFGSVAVGSSALRTALVRNAGDVPLQIGSVGAVAVLSAPFAITDNQCAGQLLAPSATCSVTLRFQPFGRDGAVQALDIASDDPANPLTFVQLLGTGTAPGDLRVADALAFPATTIGEANEVALVIRNVGAGPLEVQALTIEGAEFSVVDAAPFTVPVGASAERMVRFAPGTAGAQSATLTITSNDPDQGSVAVALTGDGTAAPADEDDGCAAARPEWATLLAICAYAACRCARRLRRRTAPSHA